MVVIEPPHGSPEAVNMSDVDADDIIIDDGGGTPSENHPQTPAITPYNPNSENGVNENYAGVSENAPEETVPSISSVGVSENAPEETVPSISSVGVSENAPEEVVPGISLAREVHQHSEEQLEALATMRALNHRVNGIMYLSSLNGISFHRHTRSLSYIANSNVDVINNASSTPDPASFNNEERSPSPPS